MGVFGGCSSRSRAAGVSLVAPIRSSVWRRPIRAARVWINLSALPLVRGVIRSGAAMFELHLLAGHAELAGAVATAVVREQSADADAVTGEEVHRRTQEADGGLGLLIGQHLGKGHARVIVDGHMQGHKAGMLALAPQPPIATPAHLGEARHALDIEVQQISRPGMFVALDRRRRVQVTPSAQRGRDAECGSPTPD